MSRPAIEIEGLVHRFKDKEALRGVDLEVTGPGVFAFLGLNGAGKSTTMRVLNGFLRPSAGRVRVLGLPVGPGELEARHRIGYLPQVPAFPPWMTGLEFLFFVADLHGIDLRLARARAGDLLDRLDLGDAAHRRIGGFSGGMRQRLGIAQALVADPELLLLDEPVSSLDPRGRAEMLGLIGEIGEKATVFMSSHILADAERICQEVAILHEGRILLREKTARLKEKYLRSTFDIRCAGPDATLEARLLALPWVLDARRVEDREEEGERFWRVRVSDAREAGQQLPGLVVMGGSALLGFELARPSLEEIFLEVVGPARSEP